MYRLPLALVGRLAAIALGVGLAGGPVAAADRPTAVAVFPVENLSGDTIPAEKVRQSLIAGLVSGGARVLADAELDAFMTRHRVRYSAGIDTATADALRKETGVDGVLIASVGLSNTTVPPKLALIARLVSIKAEPIVAWADDASMAGDDAPGLFGLGLVNEPEALLDKVLDHVGGSLVAYLKTGEASPGLQAASKFQPKAVYRGIGIQPGRTYSVAVVPFINLSGRRDAGEILALLFMRHLASVPAFRVVDAGVTRRQLLDARVIMDGGPSFTDAERVAGFGDADFVLGGRVHYYDDYEGAAGRTRVDFSAILIDRKSRKVVWSSDSYNEGSDGVRFFERGTSRTAQAMATQMVKLTAERIAGRDR